ncbi:hypothetical protein DEU56DRAFT_754287 [Suillus clintonianus]|uniref:uncharacterized protein n=1 Tax=Suillus clintonianus TaxID=1904413 RepID=UPI001B88124F|nr:uncharacterized protein DEU56DRAFT_754287 [Suillus clintonianus]KAG2144218.1 hypothetical protein DEU56DRAFT_754287 [Suillus clintonianus]
MHMDDITSPQNFFLKFRVYVFLHSSRNFTSHLQRRYLSQHVCTLLWCPQQLNEVPHCWACTGNTTSPIVPFVLTALRYHAVALSGTTSEGTNQVTLQHSKPPLFRKLNPKPVVGDDLAAAPYGTIFPYWTKSCIPSTGRCGPSHEVAESAHSSHRIALQRTVRPCPVCIHPSSLGQLHINSHTQGRVPLLTCTSFQLRLHMRPLIRFRFLTDSVIYYVADSYGLHFPTFPLSGFEFLCKAVSARLRIYLVPSRSVFSASLPSSLFPSLILEELLSELSPWVDYYSRTQQDRYAITIADFYDFSHTVPTLKKVVQTPESPPTLILKLVKDNSLNGDEEDKCGADLSFDVSFDVDADALEATMRQYDKCMDVYIFSGWGRLELGSTAGNTHFIVCRTWYQHMVEESRTISRVRTLLIFISDIGDPRPIHLSVPLTRLYRVRDFSFRK